ncbi:MAG: hypothetical protein ABR57_04450 [Acidimicrobium sp. BACL17 MAG-120924-bin0]|nr:MAG: hypothetical protein ABR57_04450 [Acidimicrobium sp. BACL17 MAG-120924-bin0]
MTTAAFSAFGDVDIVALWLLSNDGTCLFGAGARTLQRTLSALRLMSRSSSIRLVWQDFRLIRDSNYFEPTKCLWRATVPKNRIGLLCEWSG